MRTEWLIYLDDIAKTHSITKTAQRFFISQQALSFAIKKLEAEFGTTFLNRTNHGATLTPDGNAFLQKARHIMDICHDLKEEFEISSLNSIEEKETPTGKIEILSHTRLLEPLLIDLIEKYSRRYPEVQIIMKEQENINILQSISDGYSDLGLIFIPEPFFNNLTKKDKENLIIQKLFSDDFIVCCNHTHPFSQKKCINFEMISEVPTLVFDTDKRILSSGVKNDINDSDVNIFFSNNESFHKEMLRRGLAVSVITSFEFRKLLFKYKDLTAIPIDNSFKSIIAIVTASNKPTNLQTKLFIKMLLSYDFYGI